MPEQSNVTETVLNILSSDNISPEAQEQLTSLLDEILNQTSSLQEITPIVSEFVNVISKILPESVVNEIMPVPVEQALNEILTSVLGSVQLSTAGGSNIILNVLNITDVISRLGNNLFNRLLFIFRYSFNSSVELIVDILNREKLIDFGIRDAILRGVPEYTGEIAEAIIEALRLLFQSIGSAASAITSADSYPIQNRVIDQLNSLENQLYKLIDLVEDTLEGEQLSLDEINILGRLVEIFIVISVGLIEALIEVLIGLVVLQIVVVIDVANSGRIIVNSVYNLIRGFLTRDRLLSLGIRDSFANLLVNAFEGSAQFFYALLEVLSLQLIDAIKDILPEIIEIVQSLIVALVSFSGGITTIGVGLAEQGIRYLPEFIRQIIPILINLFSKVLQLALDFIFMIVRMMIQTITQIIAQLPNMLAQTITSLLGMFTNLIPSLLGGVTNLLPSLLSGIFNIIPRLLGFLTPA